MAAGVVGGSDLEGGAEIRVRRGGLVRGGRGHVPSLAAVVGDGEQESGAERHVKHAEEGMCDHQWKTWLTQSCSTEARCPQSSKSIQKTPPNAHERQMNSL